MATIGTSPEKHTIIRLEARKSFSFGLWIKDFLNRPLDITDVSLRFVMRAAFVDSDPLDATNLVTSSNGFISNAGAGYARFDIQASELDHPAGDYEFAIVMVSNGYSSVIVEGTVVVDANTEFSSMTDTFTSSVNPPLALDVLLREQVAISVYAGHALAPGTWSFTDVVKARLDALATEGWDALINKPAFGSAAFVNVDDIAIPSGGSPGAALLKSSASNYDVHWGMIATGGTGLTATGQPTGAVPTASGFDTWDWVIPVAAVASVAGRTGVITLTAADIAETAGIKMLTAAERTKLNAFSATPAYTDLAGLPTLGTIASHPVSDFLDAVTIISNTIIPKVTALRGTSRGTAAPSGGVDGDQYRQYT